MEDAAGDRYLIANHLNQTRGRLGENMPSAQPQILHAAMATLGDGSPGPHAHTFVSRPPVGMAH